MILKMKKSSENVKKKSCEETNTVICEHSGIEFKSSIKKQEKGTHKCLYSGIKFVTKKYIQ